MYTWLLLGETAAQDDGSAFVGFLILMGILIAIYSACTKKKSYRFRGTTQGTIEQR